MFRSVMSAIGRCARSRFRWWIPACVLALLTLGGIWWYMAAKDRVCLFVDGQAALIYTRTSNVGTFLREAGVTLADGDQVEPDAGSPIREGMLIRVSRAFTLDLIVGGQKNSVRTVAMTVGDLLQTRQIDLGPDDRVSPDLGQEVKPGETVRITRVSTQVKTYREKVPFAEETRKDGNLDEGTSRVVQQGQSGEVEKTVRLTIEDGKTVKTKLLDTKWLHQPVRRIVAVGTRPVVHTMVASRGNVVRYTHVLTMTATAYYPGPESCGVNAQGITYTGARATYGVVAVDPRVIPLGTRLYIEGYGYATALDTGSAIKGNKIDLCYDTYREAIMYGKHKVKVYIVAD